METALKAVQTEEHLLRTDNFRLKSETGQLRADLTLARRKPLRMLRNYLMHKILHRLSQMNFIFGHRRTARFARSAAKRNPRRAEFMLPTTAPTGIQGQPRAGRERDVSREVVMVVSHDASRTGAPIVALNLARMLSTRYDIVTLLLGGGELTDAFAETSVDIAIHDRHHVPTDVEAKALALRHAPAYAVVNSIESRTALMGLHGTGTPSVALIHEFASNGWPPEAFNMIFTLADQVVFSASLTANDALTACGRGRTRKIHITPQGKCAIPARAKTDAKRATTERMWLRRALRPSGSSNGFLVVGAGSVDYRKGVDLFISCAAHLVVMQDVGAVDFVWIGDGYTPDAGMGYSAFLKDQIERAGLQGRVRFLEPTDEIETVYEEADVFLVTSRLDPFPNVAIDALSVGTPVMCFEKATGVADFLAEAGLGARCVAQYLDPADLASKLHDVASNRAALDTLSNECRAAAARAFDMRAYVERIDALGRDVYDHAAIERDVDIIVADPAFNENFYRPHGCGSRDRVTLARDYVHNTISGRYLRKPAPGFHPGIYMEHHGWEDDVDPFVCYISRNGEGGPWIAPVIDERAPIKADAVRGLRTALQIHAFYPDELQRLLNIVSRNTVRPDLFVSAPENRLDELRPLLNAYDGHVIDLSSVPNRGRDIGPLLTLHGPRLAADYDVIGHVHTKRSLHVENRDFVERWVQFTLEGTLGGDAGGPMMDRILTYMAGDPDTWAVFPDDPDAIGWTQNRTIAAMLAQRLDLGPLPDQIRFPVGNMFWVRADLLRLLVGLGLDWPDYPVEPLPIDGTLLHAIERIIGVLPAAHGKAVAVTHVHGVGR